MANYNAKDSKIISIEKLKTFKGFENVTNEEAQCRINEIVNLSLIVYNLLVSKVADNE